MTKSRPRIPRSAVAAAGLLLLAAAAPAQVDDYSQIVYPELPEFQIPRPEIYDLPNGLKIFLMEDDELPLIQAFVRVRTGGAWEPAEKTGLASLTGSVQRTGGTRSMSGDELDDFLETRAASVETGIGTNFGSASMNCLKEDFDEVLGVFYEVLRYPAFSEDKLAVAKAQARSAVARRNDDVGAITSREFSRLVYGADSPLSRTVEYATLDAIERQDLVSWHGEFYHPSNMYLGVVGDFDLAEMKEKLAAVFGEWPAGPDFDREPVDYEDELVAGVHYVEKLDVTQANIRLGHLGIRVQNPDYFAVQVLNEILGNGFTSRLVKVVRKEKGLAYSVGGSVGAGVVYPGLASFGLQTKSESMGEAVDAVFEVLEGMLTEPATEEELERAKDSILNSFIFNYASKEQVLTQQMVYSFYGLPLDFLENYRSEIEAVDLEDVTRVAEEYLHPDQMRVLVVGRAEDFDRPLDSLGPVEEIDITIPDPPAQMQAVERTPESLAEGRRILESMLAFASGGEPAAGLAMVETIQVSMQGQQLTLSQEAVVVYPDRIRAVLKLPMGEQVLVVDGDGGFKAMGGESVQMSADEVADHLSNLSRDPQFLARFGVGEELDAAAAGSGEVEGAVCRSVEVTFRETVSRWCVDAEGRALKLTYEGKHPLTGEPGTLEVFFSDYRSVDGRRVPFRAVTHVDGTPLLDAAVQAFEFDPQVDPALFEKPAA